MKTRLSQYSHMPHCMALHGLNTGLEIIHQNVGLAGFRVRGNDSVF